jgi:hypothetical protein
MQKKTHRCALRAVILTAATLAATPAAAGLPARAEDAPAGSVRETLDKAKQALAQGRAAQAADLFESAVERGEFTEAEVGEVRARLWAGQVRHAVTISHVFAGEHPDSADAQSLLGYIEDRNGYTSQALQRLRGEQKAWPDEPAPVAAEAEVLIDRHAAGDAIAVVDRWVAAHGPDVELCTLRRRAVAVERFAAGAGASATTADVATGAGASPVAGVGSATTANAAMSPQGPRARGAAGAEATARTGSADACVATVASTAAAGATWMWVQRPKDALPTGVGHLVAAGNGLVVDGGQRVLTLSRLVAQPATTIWVKNARGEAREARLEKASTPSGEADVTYLRLTAPFEANVAPTTKAAATTRAAPDTKPAPTRNAALATTPVPTVPAAPPPTPAPAVNIAPATKLAVAPTNSHGLCFALGFPAAASTDAMMPTVTPCFAFDPRNGSLQLNIPLSAAEAGTPIFDAQGALMGLGNPTPASYKAGVVRVLSDQSGVAAANQATVAMPELYERLAPTVAQILVFAATPSQ